MSPAATAWAAKWTACWLEPHMRLSVTAGTCTGKPARSTPSLPTLAPCSSTCVTVPVMTSSIFAGSIRTRSASPWRTWASRRSGRVSRKAPPRRPNGVRTASRMTVSGMVNSFAEAVPAWPRRECGAPLGRQGITRTVLSIDDGDLYRKEKTLACHPPIEMSPFGTIRNVPFKLPPKEAAYGDDCDESEGIITAGMACTGQAERAVITIGLHPDGGRLPSGEAPLEAIPGPRRGGAGTWASGQAFQAE